MTEKLKPINSDYSSDGQITPDDIKAAAQQGFKSVLNLRSPHESGFLVEEQQLAEANGLQYTNAPLNPVEADATQVSEVLNALKDLPQPTLIHCAAGARASGIALIALAIENQLTPAELTAKAQEVGVSLDQPHLKNYLEQLKQE